MAAPTSLRAAAPGLHRTVSRFGPHLREQRTLLAFGGSALLLEVVMRLLEPWPVKFVVDAVVSAAGADLRVEQPAELGTVLLVATSALVAVVALRALFAYLSTVLFALAGNRVLTRVRGELYAHLHVLSLGYHDRARTGDLVTLLTGDVGRLQEVVVTAGLPLVASVVTLVGMLAVIALLDLQLALIVLAVLPAFVVVGSRMTRKIRTVARRQRTAEGALAAQAAETLGAVTVVQAYALERHMQKGFERSNLRSLRDGVAAKRLAAGLERRTDVLVGLATAAVLYAGARRVVAGELTPGELVVFLTYLKTSLKPLRDLAKYTGRIARAAASGERIVEALETAPQVTDASWALPAGRFVGEVSFEGVVLSYEPGHPVLQGLDLRIRAGERVAVVGASGAGKSSLVSLVTRLRDPDQGCVRIDGHDLRDLTVQSVRSQVSLVLQDSVLFVGTVRENIAVGRPGVTEAEVEAAARLAGAHEFVLRLPAGYDTVLGERGSTLSGGQRQRLAIARAAVRDSAVVVLDEPLTGLDEATARDVVAALERLTEGRTTLVVTHDPHKGIAVDRVVEVQHGIVNADSRPTHNERRVPRALAR